MGDCVEASEQAFCVVVPHHAQGAGIARRQLVVDLSDRVGDDTLDDVVSIVSELVGNAVRHAQPLPGGVVRVAWLIERDSIKLRVSDGGATDVPRVRRVGPDSMTGRGLAIVASLADRWGIIRDGLGQCVWAELRLAV